MFHDWKTCNFFQLAGQYIHDLHHKEKEVQMIFCVLLVTD